MTTSRRARLSRDGIFYTLQGEGPMVGTPSVFVRLDNCNLKCRWGDTICDAFYTSWSPSGTVEDLDALLQRVDAFMTQHKCRQMVITGGEPALQPEVVQELAQLVWRNGHSTIETNGTRFIEYHRLSLVCLSPKLSTSTPVGTQFEKVHERNRWQPDVIKKWMAHSEYYFKIVIDTPADIDEAVRMLEEVGQPLEPKHVLFMPQGVDATTLWARSRWLAEECKRLGVRFTPRIQVDIWGNQPGT